LYKKYGGTHQRGYKIFSICIDGITYRTFAHRIIYYLHTDIWDENKVINHLDEKKTNNRIENLELINQFENIIYSLRNYEVLYHPCMLDARTKAKYHLDEEKWEIFKREAYSAYRQYVLKENTDNVIRGFETLEEYNRHEAEYIERYELIQKEEEEEKRLKRKEKRDAKKAEKLRGE